MSAEQRRHLRGLYAIADRALLAGDRFDGAVVAALRGGARLIQYRDKSDDSARRQREARHVVGACRRAGALAIINDDVELALAVGAHGVHVGADDRDPATVRARLGDDAILGVSCYDRLERARAARAAGADYVAFGRMYPSATKPGGPRPGLELLGRARRETGLAICAIGGITVDRAPELVAAGADLLAVIGDLFERDDIATRAREYAGAFALGQGGDGAPGS